MLMLSSNKRLKMLVCNVFLPVLAFFISLVVTTVEADDDPEVKTLLEIKKWGENVRNRYLPKVSKTALQFIAVAIYSNNGNLGNGLGVDLDNGCPNQEVKDRKMYQCRMSAVIFNERLKQNDLCMANINNANDFIQRNNLKSLPKHNVHGEIIFIHGGILDNLVSNYLNHRKSDEGKSRNNCEIYLYSYFIPCASITGNSYSCSKEIMEYNNRRDVTCKITVVGYIDVFKREDGSTDIDQSLTWMRNGKVKIINLTQFLSQEDTNQHRAKRQTSSALSTSSGQIIFQDLMYACLKSNPLSMCCLSSTPDGFNQQKILSFFVNLMVYYCTHNSKRGGSISSHSLPDLKRCFSSWLQNNIGSDCRICSDGSLRSAWHQQYLIAICIDSILDGVAIFGRPSNGWDLTNPTWVPWRGPWNKMYRESPRTFQQRINLSCETKTLDIGSMCTRMDTKTIRRKSMQNDLINKCLWP